LDQNEQFPHPAGVLYRLGDGAGGQICRLLPSLNGVSVARPEPVHRRMFRSGSTVAYLSKRQSNSDKSPNPFLVMLKIARG